MQNKVYSKSKEYKVLNPIGDMRYKEIHIWDFPPTKTYVRLKEECRSKLFENIKKNIGYSKLASRLNEASKKYGLTRKYNHSIVYSWKAGSKKDRGKIKSVNIPLWVLLEISDIEKIEKNIEYITSTGQASNVHVKFPIFETPEMVSVIFHLCGDGHVGKRGTASHYRQINQIGLINFQNKLQNSFGKWKFKISENSKIHIPQVITDFYLYHFKLGDCQWDKARIPEYIKELPKEFLLAGLTSFIVDEGHVGEVIEIYSGNKKLIKDIREIAIKLDYTCKEIKEKYRYGKFDQYRFLISLKSVDKFYKDIENITKIFPTCGLAQKSNNLKEIFQRQNRKWACRGNNITKNMLLNLLKEKKRTKELVRELNISFATLREHLYALEKKGKIKRTKLPRQRELIWEKVS